MSENASLDRVGLKREMGLLEGVSVIVGISIGSGIFVTPGAVMADAGSVGLSLLVWVICGVLSMIGAQCYTELGTCIPKSGSDYAYIGECFGPLPSFLFLWSANVIFIPTTNAIMALAVSNYVMQPILGSDCAFPHLARTLFSILLITFFTWLNCHSVKVTTKMQNFFMVCKIFALFLICVCGVYAFANGGYTKFHDIFENSTTEPSKLAASFYSGIYSYAGWNYLNFMTEELKDPYVNLPRAIYISLPVVTILYVFTNVAYLSVLDPFNLMSSEAVAVSFASTLSGSALAGIISALVAITTLGSLSCHIMTSSRLCFVGARNGHFPACLSFVNVNKFTPQPALVFLCSLSILYLLVGDIDTLIAYTAFVETLFILCSVSGLIYLRWTQPQMERPIKVNLAFPILFVVICTFLIFMPAYERPMEVGMGLIIIATGIPVYFLGVYWQNKPTWFKNLVSSGTHHSQKLFCAIKSQ